MKGKIELMLALTPTLSPQGEGERDSRVAEIRSKGLHAQSAAATNTVGTARCAVRAAFSGATMPPSASRAGTSQRDVPTKVRFTESLHVVVRALDHEPAPNPSGGGESMSCTLAELPSWEGPGVGRFMGSPLSFFACIGTMNLIGTPLPALSPQGGERVAEGPERGGSWISPKNFAH